jgi:hypothetical protein
VWFSARGDSYILGEYDTIHVIADARMARTVRFADRPLASLTPADLLRVRKLLRGLGPSSLARPLLELLQACLEDRFGGDIALGGTDPLPAGADDIGLAVGGD